ncbi:MAG: DUF2312 domain-containing protein [Xanthobacteraceae bacterium]|nr:MAG: DUF2312 domain-containing protein [Xanthobacteraceae bacterium]
MSMSIGHNTIQGRRLLEIVEQMEAYNAQAKEIAGLKSALMAAAKSEGFHSGGIRYLIKVRTMKPHDREEADSIRDSYLCAIGMADEPPLFRLMGALAEDALTREALIEKFKELAPPQGDFIIRVGGEPVRIFRDINGCAKAEPYVEKPRPAETKAAPSPLSRPPREVPDVDDGGAEEYGRQLYRDNRPIIENPFPFGDPRRARCDEGYRKESGSDGMGPGD